MKNRCFHPLPFSIVFCVVSLLFSGPVLGQTMFFDWARNFPSSLLSFANEVQADAAGNVYVAGNFSATADFDPGPGVVNLTATNYDMYIVKLNPAGQFVWVIQLGEVGYDVPWAMAIDGSSNLYVTGSFEDTTDFDPGPGVTELYPVGQSDMFVCKFSSSGVLVWAKQMAGPDIDGGFDITVDPNGSIYTVGQFRDTADFDPGPGIYDLATNATDNAFVCKLDPNGDLVWARNIGSTGPDVARSIALDPTSGGVCVSGTFTGTVDFDPGPGVTNMTSNGNYDCFFLKMDAAGNFLWARQVGGSIDDVSYSIAVDGMGNMVSTGYFKGQADLDPGPGQLLFTGSNQPSAYILQLDAGGNFNWAKQLGTGASPVTGWGVAVDSLYNIYHISQFYGIADFDPGAGTSNLLSTNYDLAILRLDQAGNFDWVKQITGSGAEAGRGFSVDRRGNVYTSGQFQGTADFDPGPGTYSLTATPHFNAYVHKMRACWPSHYVFDVTACNVYVSPSGQYTWTTSGIYGDTILNAGGCDSILLIRLNVVSQPQQPDSISGDILLCAGSNATYSIPPVSGAGSYSWTLPSGWTGSSTTHTITVISGANSGLVEVSVVNACGTSSPATLAVTVTSAPSAAFTTSTNLLAATFTNQSTGASSWSWDFGDGNVSALQHPTHTYSTAGTYNVCLVATTNGCSDTICNSVTVIAVGTEPGADMGVTVFPNPFDQVFFLRSDRALEGHLMDINGKIIRSIGMEAGDNRLDLQGLAAGIYLLRLQDGDGQWSIRLAKTGD